MARRVLIVEDDKHFASQLKELMEFHGFAAVMAYTGPDGIDMFERERPDLVLMDVMLPSLHGIRVLERIRSLPTGSDVPAILMSAVYRSGAIFKKDMLRLGVLAFLSKPFSLIDLGRKVEQILEGPGGGRAGVRAVFDEAVAASITGAFKIAEESPDEPATPRKTSADLPSSDHLAIESDPGTDSLTELPSAMRAPEPEWDRVGEDSFVRSDTSRRLPKVGTLTPDRYVGMLTTLFHAHSSGRFSFISETSGGRRTLYLLNGYPVWVDTANPMEGLPRFLVEEGVLSQGQLAGLGQLESSSDVRAHLLRVGAVSASELDTSLEAWVAAEVRDGLGHRGSFQFNRGDDFAGTTPVYEVNPIRALWEGMERHVPLDMIRRDLDQLAGRAVGRTPTFNRLFGYIGSSSTLRKLAEVLQASRSVQDVRARFGDADGVVARCLWFMYHAGLVALSDTPQASKRPTGATRRTSSQAAAPRAAPPPRRAEPKKPPGRTEPVAYTVEFDTGSVPPAVVDRLRAAPPRSVADHAAMVVRDYVTRMDQDHYGFLGLQRTATMEEIDAAYTELAPRYRLRNLDADVGGDVRRKAKELLARLVGAFDELSDPARRAAYGARLERIQKMAASTGSIQPLSGEDFDAADDSSLGETSDPAAMSLVLGPDDLGSTWWPGAEDPAILSRRRSRLGKDDGGLLVQAHQSMARADFIKAAPILEQLRHKHPSDPGILADLGWCRFAAAPLDARTADKALEWAELALAFEPEHADALEVKARILTAYPDRKAAAIGALKRLLRVRKKSSWARSELLRLDKAGDDPGKKSKKGLGRLLGRG